MDSKSQLDLDSNLEDARKILRQAGMAKAVEWGNGPNAQPTRFIYGESAILLRASIDPNVCAAYILISDHIRKQQDDRTGRKTI